MLTSHQSTMQQQEIGDSAWQLVDMGRDSNWPRPLMSVRQAQGPRTDRRVWTEGTKRGSMLKGPSRSNSVRTVASPNGSNLSPSSSAETIPPRDFMDVRSISESILSKSDRPESLAKTLVSKGSRLLKRQNSNINLTSLRTMDWSDEFGRETGRNQVKELSARGASKHNRWRSTDNGMSERPDVHC